MLSPYVGLLIFAVMITVVLLVMLVSATLLGPKNKTATKQLPFECGAVSVGSVRQTRFNVKFYLVAMLFILFDMEVVFMYPWALTLDQTGWTGYFEMLSFMVVLAGGLVYVWRKGVLNWND